MVHTPFFPAWRSRLHRRRPVTVAMGTLRRCTLSRLEEHLAPFLGELPELSAAAASPRERPYSIRRTWWCFLWQMLQGNLSCREVVRQVQAMRGLEGRAPLDENTSGYCQARARLPEALLRRALKVSAAAAAASLPADSFLQGRTVKVLDGTALSLPDTALNQKAYPQSTRQQRGCGFPLMKLVVVRSASSGAILDYAHGDYHHAEMRLVHQLCPRLQAADIVIYDRAMGHYVGCALLRQHKIDLISRVHARSIDWREGQRLGEGDRLVAWDKSAQKPPYLSAAEWAQLPPETTVRVIRVTLRQRGFRTRHLVLVTTLLDPVAYPKHAIIAAYLQRWGVEMCLDDLKTVLGLETLRCQSPETIARELLTLLIAHNLVRAVMAQSATAHHAPLERLSFKGALDALSQFCAASAQARPLALRRQLWAEMLRIIQADRVPHRPGRIEPRAVKRRPKSYPKLNRPRSQYRDTRHDCPSRKPAKT